MAQKGQKLGRGLDSLISSLGSRVAPPAAPGAAGEARKAPVEAQAGQEVLQDLEITKIRTNPKQPRKEFAAEALNELVESLRRHGLLQPIVVRKVGEGFELIAGERRWRAAQELGWEKMQALVIELEDKKLLEVALIENIQRQDLGPIELAQAYRDLIEDHQLTQAELATRLGKSRSGIANTMRLLELPGAVKEHVSRGTVSMGAARALLALDSEEEMARVADQVAEGQLSVRQVEALASQAPKEAPSEPASSHEVDPNLNELVNDLQRALGTQVKISGSLKKGRLQIAFHSSQQLELIRGRLMGEGRSETDWETVGEEGEFTI